jgi:putrescine importer
VPLTSGEAAPAPGRLRRVLRLPDLILYGIMVIMPIAPIPLFGLAQKLSDGYAVTTILIAMFAMLLTAVSYGRMASLYPVAGSAYTYVGRGLNAHLGFLAGWAMFLDYLIVPLLCTIYGALTVQRLVPGVPYAVLALLFAGGMTALNLRGIRSTTRANFVMLVVMCAVVGSSLSWLSASFTLAPVGAAYCRSSRSTIPRPSAGSPSSAALRWPP